MHNKSNDTGQHPGYGSISVERPHYEQEQFNTELKYSKPITDSKFFCRLNNFFVCISFFNCDNKILIMYSVFFLI